MAGTELGPKDSKKGILFSSQYHVYCSYHVAGYCLYHIQFQQAR